MRITLIDNYDSFTFNLVHLFGGLGVEITVVRNDTATVEQLLAAEPAAFILSPGPCTPNEAGISLDLVRRAAGRFPIFGVCLGHQTIGAAFGAAVIRAPAPMHGKVDTIHARAEGLFRGINGPFTATRYHSLLVDRATLPATLTVTAETADGLIMGLAHREHPIVGVQFHPESILSEHGARIARNFLDMVSGARPRLAA
jgi:anthranilate synthase component 2